MQFYGGNFFTGTPGKWGAIYNRRASLALETQHYPDSPNRPEWPTVFVKAGEVYKSTTEFRFKVLA
jgi:aldose 1-epimerase